MKNIFVEKSLRNYSQTLSQKLEIKYISGSIVLKFYSLFLLYANLRANKMYWNQAVDHLLLPCITLL